MGDIPICLYYYRNTDNAYGIPSSSDKQSVDPKYRQKEQIIATIISQLLAAYTPMKFLCRKILFTPSDSTFETPSTKIYIFVFALINNNLFTKPS